jgi:hypothetical protein
MLRRRHKRNGEPTVVERDKLMAIALLDALRSSPAYPPICRRALADLLAAINSLCGQA